MASNQPESMPALVFGPPRAGVELVAAQLSEAGLAAEAWDGSAENPAAEDPEALSGRPLLLNLEVGLAAFAARSGPPWRAAGGVADWGAAIRQWDLSRQRQRQARLRARVVLDTTHLTPAGLEARLEQLSLAARVRTATRPLVVLESFAFPVGLPLDHSWCLDVRALQNPYWEPALRPYSGLAPPVQEFVLSQPLAQQLLEQAEAVVLGQLPAWTASRLLVIRFAIGCTGGFHRSVALAEALHRRLGATGVESLVWHRDLGPEGDADAPAPPPPVIPPAAGGGDHGGPI